MIPIQRIQKELETFPSNHVAAEYAVREFDFDSGQRR